MRSPLVSESFRCGRYNSIVGNNRDNFYEETKRKLGEHVNLLCSNPDCRAPTKGPHTDDEKASNVGVAAHIHGVSPDGPRYDANQTPEQRRAIENGIWLCRICDKKVDGDEAKYGPELLRAWKVLAEPPWTHQELARSDRRNGR